MTQPAKAQEPSMEEILASIRRIIADDDASKSAPRPEQPKPVARAAPNASPPPRILSEPPPPTALADELPAEPSVIEAFDEPPEDEEEAADILDLTESMTTPSFNPVPPSPPQAAAPAPSVPPQFRKIEGLTDVSFNESEPKPAPPVRNETPALRLDSENGLLSRETSAAVDSAFNALAQTVLVQNARTLEDLVREMLRPMLKSWLDDNLPGMVERLVRAEIERVARGR